jgi:dTDP-4-dehydrorhamnose 3,5-epimerase
MKFTKIGLEGPRIVELCPVSDSRGFFSRQFCVDEFIAEGLNPTIMQFNTSYCEKKGTLRGLHFQVEPYGEIKFLRCIAGEIVDFIVDVRPDSVTYLQSYSIVLSSKNRLAIYVPVGFAHGYMSLTDHAEVLYTSSQKYIPGFEKGIRWNDPSIKLVLPFAPTIVSEKDLSHPNI